MNANVDSPRSFQPGAVIGGLLLLAFGAALLLDTTGTLHMRTGHLFPAIVLIVIGATMTMDRSAFVYRIPERDDAGSGRVRVRQHRRGTGGLWLIAIGVWMFISQNHLWGFSFETSWPLFLVMTGLLMVIRGWR